MLVVSHTLTLNIERKQKMVSNPRVTVSSVVILLLAAVVQCQNKFSANYSPDDNRIIKRQHASTHAKLFLRGCDSEPYVLLNNTNSTTVSEKFVLKKATEYVFAIFTLNETAIILSTTIASHNVSINITLGINKNSMAKLEVRYDNMTIGSETQTNVPILPTIPYYVNVSITNNDISVYEARTNASEPFLNYTFVTPTDLQNKTFSVSFNHSSDIYAHYDCCEQCTPWIYSRMSGCSKYSVRTSSVKTEATHSLVDTQSPNRTDFFLFNQNVVVNHDGKPTFGAKIIFCEFENNQGSRYEIGLSDTPSIFHYFNTTANYTQPLSGLPLKQQYTWPFIVNITITRDGVVSLRIPHEETPFLRYNVRKDSKLEPVDVKYMTMVKFHEDFIRYDFYYNCTDMLFFADRIEPVYRVGKYRTELPDNYNNITSYPIICEYFSKEFKETKYDVLHIYRDSYQVDEKSLPFEDSGEYDEAPANTPDSTKSSGETEDKPKSGESSDFLKKVIVGIASCLFMGIFKMVCSLDVVKNLLKEAEVDDEKVKDIRDKIKKVVVNESVISKTFGFGDDDDDDDDE